MDLPGAHSDEVAKLRDLWQKTLLTDDLVSCCLLSLDGTTQDAVRFRKGIPAGRLGEEALFYLVAFLARLPIPLTQSLEKRSDFGMRFIERFMANYCLRSGYESVQGDGLMPVAACMIDR